MQIFSENRHFRITMKSSFLLGIWPFVFPDNPTLRKIYNYYSSIMFSYYCFFVISTYVKLAGFVLDKSGANINQVSENLCLVLIHTTTFVRQIIIKTTTVKKLIKNMLDTEDEIYERGDNEIIEIYDSCANGTIFYSKMYLLSIFTAGIIFVAKPLFNENYVYHVGNETVVIKQLPLATWLPFDEQKHYALAYLWHILNGSIAAPYVAYTDIFTYSIITYPTGQMKILSHIIRNMDKYTELLKKKTDISAKDASVEMLKEIVYKHRDIIDLVACINSAMSTIMLLDFLQCSLQLATIVTQLLGAKLSVLLLMAVVTFFIGMILRLIMLYYNANEVIVLSRGLSDAMWESPWYEKSKEVQFMVLFFLVRTKKDLVLSIGPFATMSLMSFLMVLKATYSYIMLMYGLN